LTESVDDGVIINWHDSGLHEVTWLKLQLSPSCGYRADTAGNARQAKSARRPQMSALWWAYVALHLFS